MTTVNPYLYFNGNCEEAFTFYKSVFKTEFKYLGRYKDVPQADQKLFSEMEEKIMHVTLPISEETALMGADSSALFKQGETLNTFSLSLNTDKKEEADRLFNCLAEGGTIILAMNETFWGSYYGIVKDPFGIIWKISHEPNHLSS